MTDLEIIGYAESLNESLVPRVVPPIFRYRNDPEVLLFPPFSIPEDQVLGGTIGTIAEMQGLIDRGQITGIDTPIPAQPIHSLWINSDMAPIYADRSAVEEELKAIARTFIAQAEDILLRGDLDNADAACGFALNADDRMLEPLIMRSVIRRRNGRADLADVMRDMALTTCTAPFFDRAVDDWMKRMDASEAPAQQQLDPKPQTTKVRKPDPVSSKLGGIASVPSKRAA